MAEEVLMNLGTDHYSILGLQMTATTQEIKEAYRSKLLSTHPDKLILKGGGGDGNTHSKVPITVLQIKTAYEVLSNPENRLKYDDRLVEFRKLHGLSSGSSSDGLDIVSLDDFKQQVSDDDDDESEEECVWVKDCPRCVSKESFVLTDHDLETNGTAYDDDQDLEGQAYEVVVQCSSCSLWLRVKYYMFDD
ncbi:hypothetical protein CANARDRAFT_6635 [[Candida] arabinofermentans NRRL YB-2248]|uniref:Diphthamide biosynthesis protein 4 n=1 Tax=[Candida] arabinofermentans NRRL YB-2248 TaxID=983967 RepID=A0A1E4T307_9ASCO|nr:hypothetical protein CANARDRAFT_6635 [[Candida] arabinofermentans NRRL YB-2248]